METPSNPKTEDYTYKQGQYSPRKRKDITHKFYRKLRVYLGGDVLSLSGAVLSLLIGVVLRLWV